MRLTPGVSLLRVCVLKEAESDAEAEDEGRRQSQNLFC